MSMDVCFYVSMINEQVTQDVPRLHPLIARLGPGPMTLYDLTNNS